MLEARKRRRRSTGVKRRRRVSSSLAPAKRRHTRRRRRSLLREGTLSARGGYANLAMQFLEAGAGGIAARIVGNYLPVKNVFLKGLAGAGLSVITATQLKRPILGAGMAAQFASDMIRALKIVPGLNEMEETDFLDGELSQPNMVYLAPSGEPVFLADDGGMIYADGSDSGLSIYDYN
jgi:hypothetical protein